MLEIIKCKLKEKLCDGNPYRGYYFGELLSVKGMRYKQVLVHAIIQVLCAPHKYQNEAIIYDNWCEQS